MKKLTIKSKQAQKWRAAYNASEFYCVEQCYGKPSSNKIRADRKCQELCYQQEKGLGYKIISAGTQYFTAAWMVRGGNLRVETAYNSYIIEL